jgi:hypothetical protein
VRAFRLASWLLIVPTLSLFSFSVVANASGIGAKPRYAQAVRDVAPKREKRGAFLVVKESSNPIERILNGAAQQVCWINASQLGRVAQRWPTGRMTIRYNGRPLDLVTVGGARETELRAELGNAECVLVHVSRTFYLPFETHGS